MLDGPLWPAPVNQYSGVPGSMSRAQPRMPPSRLLTRPKPWATRNCAARWLRPPDLHITMTLEAASSSCQRAGSSFSAICRLPGMLASATSHASRTSSRQNFACASINALSSTAVIWFGSAINSERERLRSRRMLERLELSLEQYLRRGSRARVGAQQQRVHGRAVSHDRQQAAAGTQRLLEATLVDRQGGGQHNGVVAAFILPRHRIGSDDLDMPNASLLQLVARACGQVRVQLD